VKALESEIAIIGGGPVGLAAACCLADAGLQVLLIDAGKEVLTIDELAANSSESAFDPRVSALTVSSQGMLSAIGAWEDIASVRLCPYDQMAVWDGEGTGAIQFSAAELHTPALGHIVENRVLTAALNRQVESRQSITVMRDTHVESIEKHEQGSITLLLSGNVSIEAGLVIGADGAHSFVRQQADFTVREWDYGHEAIVTTVKTAAPHGYTAWQRFMESGPLAFLPLHVPGLERSDQCYCSIVWSCVTERAEGIKALDDDQFKAALGAAFESRLGEVLETDRRFSFPLWQRHATDYVQDNLALIGDAAHTIHPLAGQGVNMGFADVQALSEVISGALKKGEDIHTRQVLSRYQRHRKGQNLGMMAAMEGFKRLFASEDLSIKWLRNTGMNLTNKTPLVKQQLMRLAMGL